MKNRVMRAALAAALLALPAVASAGAVAYSHEHVEKEETLEQRHQASAKISWREGQAANPNAWVRFKILGINDFHGQLEPRRVSGRPAGGAAVLAAYLKAEAANAPDGAIIAHAGDHVGASPPASALLQDEPSIQFLNLLGNKYCGRSRFHHRCNLVGTLGNHEFDEGVAEALRLLNGGNHAGGPYLQDPYRGASYATVVANVVWEDSGETILPPYVVKQVRGMPVAFIGAVLRDTPTIVTPTGVAGVRFLDEAEAINKQVARLKRKGVRAIVVLIHQGTRQASYSGPTRDELEPLEGSIVDIVQHLDDEVDIVVSGHAHSFTNTLLPNASGKRILLTQAFSASTAYGNIDVAIDPASRDIVEKSASIVTTWADEGPGLEPDPQVAALVEQAVAAVDPLVNRQIGEAAAALTRTENAAGESALGNLIADAMRGAMGTDFAFMNPGGIRADLDAGPVTWGELFTVQPFNNDLVRMRLTGAQIVQLLNQQWAGQPFPRIMKTSGLRYTWDANLPVGDRIVAVTTAAGEPLNPAASYSVTVNSFMAAGGDNYSVLPQGVDRVVGPVDLDALVDHVEGLEQPFSTTVEGRIQRLN